MVSVSDIGMKIFSASRERAERHEFDRKECEFASEFVSARHHEIRLEGRSVNPEAGEIKSCQFSPFFQSTIQNRADGTISVCLRSGALCVVGGGGSIAGFSPSFPKLNMMDLSGEREGNGGKTEEEEEVDQRRLCCCLPFGTWSQLSLSLSPSLSLFLGQPRSFVCFDRIGGGGGGGSAGQGIYHQSRLIVTDFCASVSSYLEKKSHCVSRHKNSVFGPWSNL